MKLPGVGPLASSASALLPATLAQLVEVVVSDCVGAGPDGLDATRAVVSLDVGFCCRRWTHRVEPATRPDGAADFFDRPTVSCASLVASSGDDNMRVFGKVFLFYAHDPVIIGHRGVPSVRNPR